MNTLILAAALAAAVDAAPVDRTPTKPILIVATSHATKGDTGQPTGVYLGEMTHSLAEFDAAGIPVEIASIRGGEPPIDGLKLDDPINARYWSDAAFRQRLRTTRPLSALRASDYSAVLFAGGHGTMWDFPDDADVQRLAREIYENGGVVAAVCHGPAALVNVRLSSGRFLVEGREVAAFTDDEERAEQLDGVVPFLLASTLEARGAIHRPAANWQAQVVVDGRLVTGQNPASGTGVGKAIVELLSAAGTP